MLNIKINELCIKVQFFVFLIKKVSASFNLMEVERICSFISTKLKVELQAGDNVEYEVTDGRKENFLLPFNLSIKITKRNGELFRIAIDDYS